MAVYSNAGCTQELGTDGFEQTRQEFADMAYMPSYCVPDTGKCFVLTAACSKAYERRFSHFGAEYDGKAAAIRIITWTGDNDAATTAPVTSTATTKLQINAVCDPRNDLCDASIDLHCPASEYKCRYKTTSTTAPTTTKLQINDDCDPRKDLCDESNDLHCHDDHYKCRYKTTTATTTATTTTIVTSTTISVTSTTTAITSTTTAATTTSATSTPLEVNNVCDPRADRCSAAKSLWCDPDNNPYVCRYRPTTTTITTTIAAEATAGNGADADATTADATTDGETNHVNTIIGIAVGVVFLIIIAGVVVLVVLRKSSGNANGAPNGAPGVVSNPASFENPMYAGSSQNQAYGNNAEATYADMPASSHNEAAYAGVPAGSDGEGYLDVDC